MTSCRHGHLPKDPLANTVTLRVRASVYELQGTHSVLNVTREEFMSSGPSTVLPQLWGREMVVF